MGLLGWGSLSPLKKLEEAYNKGKRVSSFCMRGALYSPQDRAFEAFNLIAPPGGGKFGFGRGED